MNHDKLKNAKFIVSMGRFTYYDMTLVEARAFAKRKHTALECWHGTLGNRVRVLKVDADGSYTWLV